MCQRHQLLPHPGERQHKTKAWNPLSLLPHLEDAPQDHRPGCTAGGSGRRTPKYHPTRDLGWPMSCV